LTERKGESSGQGAEGFFYLAVGGLGVEK